ncbi:MAG TPA: 50S ribosomal protein L4 [Candidatus Dormibacteraeota bacterium]|nr:50S ribosomal protein L4 [Candidatus Dormibacteraeota bacterium]
MAEPTTLPVVTQTKEPAGDITLPAGTFDGPVRKHLLYEVVNMQRANRRAGTHATKTRGEVRGGGKKPWRQKGTGRARAGSSRSPIWTGGAIIFGPQPRDYSYRLPASARRSALRSALAARLRENALTVVDKIEIADGKTKSLVQVLQALGLERALIIIETANPLLERAARNLPTVKVLRVEGANVYDILRHPQLVVTRAAVDALRGRVAP